MGNQALLLFGSVVCTAGNHSRHRLVAVANQHFFAVLYELDVSAEVRFQVADVYGTHKHIITNLTMLVMFILVLVNANAGIEKEVRLSAKIPCYQGIDM